MNERHEIDEPLAIVRFEYSDSIAAPIMLLPHANSRGGVDTAPYQSPYTTYTPVLTRRYGAPIREEA